MHELGRPGRGPAGQIVHFTEENRISAPHRIARDTAAIDAAADNREVEGSVQRRFPGISLAVLLSVWIKSNQMRKQPKRGIGPERHPCATATPLSLEVRANGSGFAGPMTGSASLEARRMRDP